MRLFAFLTLAVAAFGQPAFEAASLKPSAPGGPPFSRTMGGPGTKDPGRIRYLNTPLKSMLQLAFGLSDYQITGPSWMETDRFDVEATVPPSTTREQLPAMLQALLTERFKLTFHRETRETAGYALVTARGGPKLTESAPAGPEEGAPLPPPGRLEMDRHGFPILPAGGPPGMMQLLAGARGRVIARRQTMHDLAQRLTELLGRPVSDATGLTGPYDFTITFAADGTALTRGPAIAPPPGAAAPPPDPEPPQDLPGVLQSQLGLRFESKRSPVSFLIIDRVERTPVGN